MEDSSAHTRARSGSDCELVAVITLLDDNLCALSSIAVTCGPVAPASSISEIISSGQYEPEKCCKVSVIKRERRHTMNTSLKKFHDSR